MAGSRVIVDANALQGMLNYLAKCPYHEVAPLLVGIQEKIQPYTEPKAITKENVVAEVPKAELDEKVRKIKAKKEG